MAETEKETIQQVLTRINNSLSDYQKTAKEFLMKTPRAGLFLDIGFGKTITTLAAELELAASGQLWGHILIIAPKAIARSTWIDEITKWNIPCRVISLITNEKGKSLTADKRHQLYAEMGTTPASIYIINKDLVIDLVNWFDANKKPWPLPNIIIDELQGFKSYNAQRFKALKKILPQTRRFIGLTGTPIPNGLMDLWPEIYLMDGGARLGKTITAYRDAFFLPGLIVDNYPVTWIPRRGAETEIYNRVNDLVISIKNPNLKLPALMSSIRPCNMSDKEKTVYKKFAKECVLNVATQDGKIEINAANAAVLTNKLKQLSSGTIYTDDKSQNYAVLHKHKLEELLNIINNTNDNILVAYYFKSEKTEILEYLMKNQIKAEVLDGSPEMIHRWNEGKIPVMLLQPASCCHGINIQKGGHTLVWYTIPDSLEHYLQTNGRLNRRGQPSGTVMIHHIITTGTIDEKVLKTLGKKDQTEKDLLNAVSDTVKSIMN